MTTILGRTESRRGNVVQRHGITLLTLILLAYVADARPPATDIKGLVSIADGEPFTVIRGDDLRKGTKGISLFSGDILETGPDAFLVIELQGGSLIGIGPSSEVYFLPHSGVATLAVLKGWLKADMRGEAQSNAIRILGTRLGIQCQRAVVLLHADEGFDSIFDEQGSGTLLLRDAAATSVDKETRQNQFFRRAGHSAVVEQPHPSPDFLAQMPIAFRDTLPGKASAGLKAAPEPKPVRKVTYVDIQSWLTMPRDWRGGFITRFRSRLTDPAFFAAMDAHLALHPEWIPILHPPPKPSDQGHPEATSQGTVRTSP